MTLQEFKAWFEGFTENLDGTPNAKQWKRIQKRVQDINGTPVTPVIIERYYRRYAPDYTWCTTGGVYTERLSSGRASAGNTAWAQDRFAGMTILGRNEAKSLIAAA